MKIININCTKCGSTLEVNKSSKYVTCKYCNNNFYIDDEVKKVEINIKDNNDLENAKTYLDNFKEYDKSLKLYSKLSIKHANNKDIWIGILRSLTHDFTKTDYAISDKKILEKTWSRFCALASQEEINMYNDKVGYAFNIINKKIAANNLKKRKRNFYLLLIFITILILSIVFITLCIIKPVNQRNSFIKLSEIINKCDDLNKCSMKPFVSNSISSKYADIISISVPDFNLKKNSYSAEVTLYNFLGSKSKYFDYKIIDDIGPIITTTNCSIFENETFDHTKCISAYDFTDGDIKINKEDIELAEPLKVGKNTYVIKIKDSDGNISKKTATLSVKQIPITKFDLNVSKNIIKVGETTTYSLNIEPDVDKTYHINYDSNVISVNGNNVTGLSKGETNLCAYSDYDSISKDCVSIKVELICKNTYIFNFTGGKDETIKIGDDMCPGTYKVYAPSVLNYDDSYYIRKNNYNDYVNIWKRSNYLNDEGKKFILEDGDRVTVDAGILSVKLVKVK